jgi:hypothetical protein
MRHKKMRFEMILLKRLLLQASSSTTDLGWCGK